MDISEPTALRDHPHVQTVLVRLEKRKLDNSINGEAYRTAKIQILAGLDLALRSKVTMEQSLFDMHKIGCRQTQWHYPLNQFMT